MNTKKTAASTAPPTARIATSIEKMPFASFVFNENETARDRLEKCRTDHAFNLWQFSRDVGAPEYKLAVGRVQDALRMLFAGAPRVIGRRLDWRSNRTVQVAGERLWLRVDALAALLSVLWAAGLLSWLVLGTVARTRRQVASETAAAQPQGQAPRGEAGPVRVRTQPRRHAATLATGPAAGRSALAQQALRRAVRP